MEKQDQDKIIEHAMKNINSGHRIYLRAVAKDLHLNDHSPKDLIHIAEEITFDKRYKFDTDKDFGIYVVVDTEYKEPTERDKETADLSFTKLQYDVKNAKRVYKSYWWTFAMSLIALVISIILLILKLKE